eukprot:8773877-Pyramimonas_sp.AAC.1
MAKNLFAEGNAEVDELKAEHKQLAARMAVKRRRTGEQGQGVAGGDAAPRAQGAGEQSDDGSAPTGAEAATSTATTPTASGQTAA